MSKQQKSKLDQFADRLDEWFGVEKKTIAQVQEQLRLDGCSVSSGRLSEWWHCRQREKMQAALLSQITTGANQVKAVEKAWGQNPPPELSAIIKLHRTLIWKLATEGTVAPEMLELVSGLMKSVVDFDKLNLKREEFSLARDKFQFDAVAACRKQMPSLKAIEANKSLSETEKTQLFMEKLFGTKPK